MKDLMKNVITEEVLKIVFKQILPFMTAVWFTVSLVAMLITIKDWSEFATGDFIFGMIFVANIGFVIVIFLQTNKMTELRTQVRELENSVIKLEKRIDRRKRL